MNERISDARAYDRATLLLLAAAGLVACTLVAGCSGGSHTPADAALARESLRTVLESWKNGEPARALKDRSPSIVAQDLEWAAGAKLVDYQIVGDGQAIESNLHVPVSLSLLAPKGKVVKKNASYIIGTSPYVTVFRALR